MTVNGAKFSPCRNHRYSLWRGWTWDQNGVQRRVMFIGLNPSKADEIRNDLTVTKCIRFAQNWQFGGMFMANLYSLRATNPIDLCLSTDQTRPQNVDTIIEDAKKADAIVACWGALDRMHRERLQWSATINRLLTAINRPVMCFGKTRDKSPRHPSRISYTTNLEPFWEPIA